MISKIMIMLFIVHCFRSTSVRLRVLISEVDCLHVWRSSLTQVSWLHICWERGWTGDSWLWCVELLRWCCWSVSSTHQRLHHTWWPGDGWRRRAGLCSGCEVIWLMCGRSWPRYRSMLRDLDSAPGQCHPAPPSAPDSSSLSSSPAPSCSSPGSPGSSPSTSTRWPSSARCSPPCLLTWVLWSVLWSSSSHL